MRRKTFSNPHSIYKHKRTWSSVRVYYRNFIRGLRDSLSTSINRAETTPATRVTRNATRTFRNCGKTWNGGGLFRCVARQPLFDGVAVEIGLCARAERCDAGIEKIIRRCFSGHNTYLWYHKMEELVAGRHFTPGSTNSTPRIVSYRCGVKRGICFALQKLIPEIKMFYTSWREVFVFHWFTAFSVCGSLFLRVYFTRINVLVMGF